MKKYLEILQRGKRLNREQLQDIYEGIFYKKYNEIEIGAFLYGLSIIGETSNEIVPLVKFLREKKINVDISGDILDVCGTGGDGKDSLNISTAVSFVTSACGIITAKHGNRAVSSQSGSSDVLLSLGVNIDANIEKIKNSLDICKLSFLFAPLYHHLLKEVADLRRTIGVRTIFNLLGPLINPANSQYQLIGIANRKLLAAYAESIQELNYKKVVLVSSYDGFDEISVCDKTEVYEIEGKELMKKYSITPEDYGIKRYMESDLQGGDSDYNAKMMLDVFTGNSKRAYYDAILLNSSFAIAMVKNISILDSISMARKVLDEGLVYKKLKELKECLK